MNANEPVRLRRIPSRRRPYRRTPTLARLGGVAAVLLVGAAAPRSVHAQTRAAGAPIEEYLSGMGLSAAQLDSIADGRVVVRLLPGGTDRDVAVIGVIRLEGAPERVRARVLDVGRFLTASGRRYQQLSDPATDADVRDAELDESEYRDLRKCRPGDCDFKLPATAMQSFVEQVDWSAPDAKAQADVLMRAGLLRLAADYRARGNAATPAYDDVRGVQSGKVFEQLVKQSPDMYEYAPELERYLTTYPTGRPPATRDFLYWSEDRLPHLRPILTLNHVVVYSPPGGTAFVARKQIYASHYFEGAFELLAVVDGGAGSAVGTTYLLVLRRFRFDNLPGGPTNIRGRVRQQLVELTCSELQRAYADTRAPAN